MVIFNIAYTAPINPAGAAPVLSQPQVWAGLERKVRRAQEFVPVIKSCDVVSEKQTAKGLVVVRDVQFTFAGPKGDVTPIREVCTHFAPCRIDFEQENGSFVSNIVSKGPDGELLMTYSFVWIDESLQEGSPEVEKVENEHWQRAKMAVEGSINTIRRLVKDSVLQ
ncbi:hypothetical protein JX265_004698 [Neoarthrinium moseri]|uniref:DUF1857-domain-containing protein n=1 Tax=Neoarthrinium moseri TaxID=1658444 RepID=A0A9P9WPV6_9PEZI|nr:hypothetical protein JX266_012225 [Neoarthrinium moseri]KAI1874490.1 hypothetical protein JX265_004698 [Neoarthrinium moseri]